MSHCETHPLFIRRIFQRSLSDQPLCLLIRGETGCGKTEYAKNLHHHYVPGSPFVHLNMAAMPENLIESELFGYEKGAYTGADKSSPGKVTMAKGGVLFLDEIGELPLSLQGKLLTFLDSGEYYPLGAKAPQRFRGKLVFATNQDLEKRMREGTFRKDLYFRLRNFQLKLTPLRNNIDDIGEKLHSMLLNLSQLYGLACPKLSTQAEVVLKDYSWPGNYRELKNLAQYLLFNVEDLLIRPSHLPAWLQESSVELGEMSELEQTFHEALGTFEKKYLTQALRKRDGRINLTARELCLSKTTLIAKVRKYGIKSGAS